MDRSMFVSAENLTQQNVGTDGALWGREPGPKTDLENRIGVCLQGWNPTNGWLLFGVPLKPLHSKLLLVDFVTWISWILEANLSLTLKTPNKKGNEVRLSISEKGNRFTVVSALQKESYLLPHQGL